MLHRNLTEMEDKNPGYTHKYTKLGQCINREIIKIIVQDGTL